MADAKTNADRIEKRLDATISKLERGQKINTVIGVILIVVLLGYFGWLISMVKDIATPQSVSELVMGKGREIIPEARKNLSNQLTDNAEKYINEAVDEVLASVPQIRREAHKFALQQADKYIRQVRGGLEDMMDKAIESHSAEISLLIEELQTVEGTREFEETLYEILMVPVREEGTHVEIEAYGLALVELSNKLERLANDQDLTESERVERDIIIALKEFSDRSN